MWEQAFDQLTEANRTACNLFWPDMDKETEEAVLHHLFTTALARGMLTDERIERFLSQVLAVNDPTGMLTAVPDMESATRGLLDMDEALSPLSVVMFGRGLLPDADRRQLTEALEIAAISRA